MDYAQEERQEALDVVVVDLVCVLARETKEERTACIEPQLLHTQRPHRGGRVVVVVVVVVAAAGDAALHERSGLGEGRLSDGPRRRRRRGPRSSERSCHTMGDAGGCKGVDCRGGLGGLSENRLISMGGR